MLRRVACCKEVVQVNKQSSSWRVYVSHSCQVYKRVPLYLTSKTPPNLSYPQPGQPRGTSSEVVGTRCPVSCLTTYFKVLLPEDYSVKRIYDEWSSCLYATNLPYFCTKMLCKFQLEVTIWFTKRGVVTCANPSLIDKVLDLTLT